MIRRLLPPNTINRRHVTWARWLLHLICWFFLLRAYYLALNDKIGGDPVESLIHFYGLSALKLLLLTLMITPLVRYSRQTALMMLRRPLGLYAALFASAHLCVYIAYDLQFNWPMVASEIAKRPYITVGFVAWLLLLALAITSLPKLVRSMGKRWKQLHNFIYLIGILACLHFLWSVKADLTEPAIYTLILAILLFLRGDKFLRYFRKRPANVRPQ